MRSEAIRRRCASALAGAVLLATSPVRAADPRGAPASKPKGSEKGQAPGGTEIDNGRALSFTAQTLEGRAINHVAEFVPAVPAQASFLVQPSYRFAKRLRRAQVTAP